MNASSTAPRTRRLTVARLIGTVGVVGAAAAVAGMGTFGAFTDSTSPAPVSIESGVVSIALAAADGTATVPLAFDGVVPGASVTQALDLVNDGDSGLASVRLDTRATTSSVMDTDTVHGLQMTVQSCSVAWDEDFACAGDVRTLLASGPVVRDSVLTAPASLAAGATDHLAVSLALPASADDTFKAQSSELALTFTATQRGGTAR
ncbi:TasA family protein [Modestobacter italicus]|uniref:TasA family protein n=1 Tax=Modestobacter italicus (strain DSM 44449 / CECT 9708 / BC 501) TaxID=2732864 RepID=UPI001C97B812|nr:TasA family protein [Modestobacter italicus]